MGGVVLWRIGSERKGGMGKEEVIKVKLSAQSIRRSSKRSRILHICCKGKCPFISGTNLADDFIQRCRSTGDEPQPCSAPRQLQPHPPSDSRRGASDHYALICQVIHDKYRR